MSETFGRTFDGTFGRTFDGTFGRAFDGTFGRTFDGTFGRTFDDSKQWLAVPVYDSSYTGSQADMSMLYSYGC